MTIPAFSTLHHQQLRRRSLPFFLGTAIDESQLRHLATVLFQLRHVDDHRLYSRLRSLSLPSPFPHESFIQLCSRFFSSSWKPPNRFSLFAQSQLCFSHSPTTAAVLLSVYANSRNTDLLLSTFNQLLLHQNHLITLHTISVYARGLAEANHSTHLFQLFPLLSVHKPLLYNCNILNSIVEMLVKRKHVGIADNLVKKIGSAIVPDVVTYRFLVLGYCRIGELESAAKVWNRIAAAGMEPDAESYDQIVVAFFKNNRVQDAILVFKSMRIRRFGDMGMDSYKNVITWFCKERKVDYACMVFAEMLKRGVGVDNETLGALVYGLLVKKKLKEGYKVLHGVSEPDISLYHGLIKGLIQLKRPGEATDVFREMVRRGVEPIMHTYVMLLQGHLGKKGRKAKDSAVNFDSIFIGGLVKVERLQAATKYIQRTMSSNVEVPRFDYNKFLHEFSNEEGIMMFEEVGRKLKEAGMDDLGDILLRYGEKMTTRERRRRMPTGYLFQG